MTTLQKIILKCLFEDGTIAKNGIRFRLRDNANNPVSSFTYKTYNSIRFLLRRKNGLMVLNKSIVRKQHGKSWIKQFYKQQLKNQKVT